MSKFKSVINHELTEKQKKNAINTFAENTVLNCLEYNNQSLTKWFKQNSKETYYSYPKTRKIAVKSGYIYKMKDKRELWFKCFS